MNHIAPNYRSTHNGIYKVFLLNIENKCYYDYN